MHFFKRRQESSVKNVKDSLPFDTNVRNLSETAEEREILLQKRRAADSKRRTQETPERKRAHLGVQIECDHLKRNKETPDQRQERLQSQRARDQSRRNEETPYEEHYIELNQLVFINFSQYKCMLITMKCS